MSKRIKSLSHNDVTHEADGSTLQEAIDRAIEAFKGYPCLFCNVRPFSHAEMGCDLYQPDTEAASASDRFHLFTEVRLEGDKIIYRAILRSY